MKIAFIFREWFTGYRPLDFNNLWTNTRGLTGSDLGITITASEMVKLGHDVSFFTVYTENKPDVWQGVKLRTMEELSSTNTEEFDVVISWSDPDVFRSISKKPLRVCCMMLNDFNYCQPGFDDFVDVWTSPCQMLLDYLQTWTTTRGIYSDPQKWNILPLGCESSWYNDNSRVPGRVVWTSSADRGLHVLLEQWPKIKAAVPEANLRVFYNFNYKNIENIEPNHKPDAQVVGSTIEIAHRARYMKEAIKRLRPLGVEHIGSISREQMAKELSEAMVLGYSFSSVAFTEGFSVSLLEACAAGVVPITSDGDCLGSIYKDVIPMVKSPIEKNVGEYSSLVVKGLTDNNFRQYTIKRCKEFAQKHTWTESAHKLENIIKSHQKYNNDRMSEVITEVKSKSVIAVAKSMISEPAISIIMPTMRVGGLDVVFKSLENQTFKNFEFIIVDGIYKYRKDLVAEKAKQYNFLVKHVEPIKNNFPISCLSHSTNTGFINASAKLVLMITDYTYLPKDCIEKHIKFHTNYPAENMGYMCPHQYRALPILNKDFLPYKNEDTDIYVNDLKNRKFDDMFWSIFKNNFDQDPETLSLDSMGNADNKLFQSFGVGNLLAFNGKNESLKLEAILKINGWDEELDGAVPYQDQVFSYMLVKKLGFTWMVDKDNKVYIINPRFVMPWSKRIRSIESNREIQDRKLSNNFKDPINKWNLREAHKAISYMSSLKG